MKTATLLLPVETRTREIDGKLLLACFLAERGIKTVIGSRISMHMNIAAMPRGIYLSKDFRRPVCRIFRILNDFGCPILAWDEEGVLFYSAKEYHRRRVAECAFSQVEEFFAWGEENREMINSAPCYSGAPVHVTGNPRFDLLRPSLRAYYQKEVEAIRQKYGRFILINTNFGKLNSHIPSRTIKNGRDPSVPDGKVNDYMKAAWAYRSRVFEAFQAMLPAIAKARPDRQIIIRPHPAENMDFWKDIARAAPNIQVVHEGNVHPWLLASDVMIHNGCTTGIEAFFLEVPVISYQPVQSNEFDFALSNDLSHKSYDLENLIESINEFCDDQQKIKRTPKQLATADKNFAALDGPLSAVRIADLISDYLTRNSPTRNVTWGKLMRGRVKANIRKFQKLSLGLIPNHKNSFKANRHRFPDMAQKEVEERIKLFSSILGRFETLQVRTLKNNVFEVSCAQQGGIGKTNANQP